MKFLALSLLALSVSVDAWGPKKNFWGTNFKNLVAFGDSYTDEGRLGYFAGNNGAAPPPGYVQPIGENTASGGRSWARYVSTYTGAKLYNYAVSGAVCSNNLTPRIFGSINAPFPSVREYEIPAYKQDEKLLKIKPSESLYSIWIGTNDIGANALVSHEQLPGVSLVNYTDCVISALNDLYKQGARNFVLQNLAPLQYAPIYTSEENGGEYGKSVFWGNRDEQYTNLTRLSEDIRDLVWNGNEIFQYKAPAVVSQWKGAKLAVFDSYGLLLDIYKNPANYLNGSLPLNVTGYNNHCSLDWQCETYRANDRDSFFWYDSLHPSEQVGRVIAREFAKIFKGEGKWTSFFG